MVEYTKKAASSGVAKTALGLGIGALGWNALGGMFGLGTNGGEGGALPFRAGCGGHGGYVTGREMELMQSLSAKDAIIANQSAERYALEVADAKVAPLYARMAEAETALAVNAARDRDYRHYVEREFVHQPKARIRNSIVTCQTCGCCCDCDDGADD